MKKRIISMLIVMVVMAMCCVNALAQEPEIRPYTNGGLDGGLISLGNGKYEMWGTIEGTFESLSIRLELRTTSGTYIDSISNSGTGPIVEVSKTVRLSKGTYYLYIYGTTSNNTPSEVLSVRAQ